MNTIVIVLCVLGILAICGGITGLVVYLDNERARYRRVAVSERLRAREAEDALSVKHDIEALYTQARDRIRRAA